MNINTVVNIFAYFDEKCWIDLKAWEGITQMVCVLSNDYFRLEHASNKPFISFVYRFHFEVPYLFTEKSIENLNLMENNYYHSKKHFLAFIF